LHKTISIDDQLNSFIPLIQGIAEAEDRGATIELLSDYRRVKKCKLSWYITMCARNRIVDLKRKATRVPTVNNYGTLDETTELDLELDRVTTFNPFSCVEFNSICRSVLSDKEFGMLKEYYEYGHQPKDIFNNKKNNIEMLKPSNVVREDIKSCLNLISQKLKLKEKSQQTII